MKTEATWLALLLAVCVATGCRLDTSSKNSWIEGNSNERWTAMERQLRGLDVAMVEMGYRYEELYWAARYSLMVGNSLEARNTVTISMESPRRR